MKQLFWKEWYELRRLPLMSAVCMAMLFLVANFFSAVQMAAQRPRIENTYPLLVITWLFSALLAGAGLFTREVGSGGLQFLSALPTSRRRLWWVKVTTALGMLLLSMICSAVTWLAVDAMMFQVTLFAPLEATMHSPGFIQDVREMSPLLPCFFAVALAVSPLFDRSISTVFTSLLVSWAYCGALQTFAYDYVDYYRAVYEVIRNSPHIRNGDWLFLILVSLSLLVFVTISYWTFTRGETLRSVKRFRVGALSGAAALGVSTLVFWAGFGLNLW